jgi:hypothetical protein
VSDELDELDRRIWVDWAMDDQATTWMTDC